MSTIIVDTRDVRRLSIQLEGLGRGAPLAVAAALNRSLTYANTLVRKDVAKNYEIQQKYVKETISQRKASPTKLKAEIISKGTQRSLTRFKVKPSKPPNQKGKKISQRKLPQAKVFKSVGYKTINIIPGAFVAKMNNATNVWQRKGKGRTDVKILRSLSVPQMIENDNVIMDIKAKAMDYMDRRLEHEINYRLQKLRGGGSR